MIILIQGLAGSGKTWLMSRLLQKEWKLGSKIYPNFPLWFDEEKSNITRWHVLDDTYHIRSGVIAIDESQKLLDARRWQSLPMSFMEKIAMHRHHSIDIYTTTQDMGHIDIRVRSNVHELFTCQSVLRIPRNQRHKPLIQIIKVTRSIRHFNNDTQRVRWEKIGYAKYHFISRFWTKTYYNTYGEVGQNRFICRGKFQRKGTKKVWTVKVYSRDLVNSGKARL